nr:hypothetical protein [Tanacetum cinerariifolium]
MDTTSRYKNDNQSGQFGNQRMMNVAEARENVDSVYHKEKMLLCKQAEKGVPLQAEQYDWLADTDEKIDEQELEAYYSYMAKIQEVPTAETGIDFEPLEQVQNDTGNVIPDAPDMCDDDIQNDQNDVESDDESVELANLIANLKLDVDENKKIQKQLKKANTTLAQELKECKTILAETSKTLGESISVQDSCKTKVITDLKLKEEHDIDKMLSTKKQLKFLNEIVYKRSQSIQTIHMMGPKVSTYNGRPTFANPRYLKQARFKIPCLYAFPYDQSTHANRLIPDGKETLALERESRSKLNKDLVRPYDYTTLNSLYEIFKPPTQEFEIQLAYANEIRKKMWRKSFVKYKPYIYKNVRFLPISQSISKSRQAYNVMTNNINHFKEIVDDAWIKHLKDQFCALTAQDMEIPIQTCLMPLALMTHNDSFIFVHELKQEMHADLKYAESLKKEIDELESDKAEFSNMYDVILQECVSNDVKCSYLLSLSDLDALAELQCLYLHKVKECDCLAQKLSKQTESVSKGVHTELLQRFAKVEKHSISLEIALQKCKEQRSGDRHQPTSQQSSHRSHGHNNDCHISDRRGGNDNHRGSNNNNYSGSNNRTPCHDRLSFLSNIAISELKKLIEKGKGKSVETKFDRPSLIRQPNAQRISKPLVLGKPAPFSNSLERRYFSLDGENLDKMKEKWDLCVLVGYSNQSKGYRVYNKRTKLIVESIHIRFDEFKEISETFVANDTSVLIPQQQKASDYDNSDPVPQLQNVSSSADVNVPSQQGLDLLFGPLYDEFFNAGLNPQDKQPTTNIQPILAPSTPTYVHAEENNNDQAKEEHLQVDEFTNPFCALTQEVNESSSHNIGNSNVPTFNQPKVFEYR